MRHFGGETGCTNEGSTPESAPRAGPNGKVCLAAHCGCHMFLWCEETGNTYMLSLRNANAGDFSVSRCFTANEEKCAKI